MASKKTLAMKLLDGKKISYNSYAYPNKLRDAQEVALALGLPPEQVFKTLVVSPPPPGKPILAMIPANSQVDLKKLAKSVGEKKLKMASQREAEKLTGLQVGGISALALMNRGFMVYLDISADRLQEIVISAGERGQQIELAVGDLVRLTRARLADIAHASSGQERQE